MRLREYDRKTAAKYETPGSYRRGGTCPSRADYIFIVQKIYGDFALFGEIAVFLI